MHRVAVILLAGGVVLLVTWIAAPASPHRIADAPANLDAISQAAPDVEAVNEQVRRLRERLTVPPAFPPPTRNPFRFGAPPRPRQTRVTPPVPEAPPPPPAPALPSLIAITSDGAPEGTVHRGVVRIGDAIRIVKAGDVIGTLVVRAVTATMVELVDPATDQTYRVTLR